MSRCYSMEVNISGFDKNNQQKIIEACVEEWPFEEDDFTVMLLPSKNNEVLTTCADGNLCGGEQEDEFAARLSKAVWIANGKFCKVVVHATYLDDLPYDTYVLDQEDYNKIML